MKTPGLDAAIRVAVGNLILNDTDSDDLILMFHMSPEEVS